MRKRWIEQMAKNRTLEGVKNSKLILQEMFICYKWGKMQNKVSVKIPAC